MSEVTPVTRVRSAHVLDPLRPYLCGGLAAVVAEMATFPLDTTKTRHQLQGQVGDGRWSHLRYRGILHTLGTIAREEGLVSIYRGLSPALVRQAVYGTLKFGLYYSSKDLARKVIKNPGYRESNLVNLCSAVLAGSLSAALANPTDVIKVRMQSGVSSFHRGARHSWSLLSVGRLIYSQEGVRGLWRGVVPTAQRAALVAGVQLPVYDAAKRRLLHGGLADGACVHLAASGLAGLSACLASNPVDVVRTRMMVQRRTARSSLGVPVHSSFGEGGHTYYSSSLRCAANTVRTEGMTALYKGFLPAFARMGPWNVIFFLVYERLQSKRPYIGR